MFSLNTIKNAFSLSLQRDLLHSDVDIQKYKAMSNLLYIDKNITP